ncbi:MAG: ribose ABC transporter permease [Treponema sp.]|nr:ribose ABC transporter permease [Treponema sp.]
MNVVLKQLKQLGILFALIGIMITFTVLSPVFLTVDNLTNIVVQSSINGIIAVGMTLVIIQGGIDLSVGSLVAVVGVVVTTCMVQGMSVPLAIALGLGIGLLVGGLNGTMISRLGLQPFIVTLGTMSLLRGTALVYSHGDPIFKVSRQFRAIFAGQILGLPGPIFYLILVAAIGMFILNFTRFGVYIKAIGGSEEAARMSGVNVSRYKILTYAICSLFTAVAALVMVGRLGAAEPIAGSGFELDAIAATAVGGTSMSGGKGNVTGTILGALILGALRNGLTLLNVQSFYQVLATGAIILIAVSIDRFAQVKKS